MTLLLAVVVLTPILAWLVLSSAETSRSARGAFTAAAFATAGASIALAVLLWRAREHPVTVHLGLAGRDLACSVARVPFLCLVTVAFAVVALVAGPGTLERHRARASSAALSALVVSNLATDLGVLTLALVVLGAVVVDDVARSGSRAALADARVTGFTSAIGCTAFALAAVTTGGSRVLAPIATHAHLALDLATVPVLARDAIVLGCSVGIAAFPFAIHLPRVFERASLGVAVATVLVSPVLVITMHAVLPTLGAPDGAVMSVVAIVATVGAGITALSALGQRSPRRMLGSLVASQNGLVLAGLATRTTEGGVAAVVSTIGTSLAAVGLLVLTHELEARVGAVDLRGSHGFARPWPRLGALYLLLALVLLGFPGSPRFFAEDLFLQGFLATHPPLAYAVLLVAAIDGVTILRSYFALFLGPNREVRADHVPADLGRRGFLGPAVLLAASIGLVALSPTIGALVER